jgi:O-antigen/teichoic acid export membrane protein
MLPMPEAASLRSNFAWTFAGNAVYAAGQWVILSLLAKLGSSEMLGQYALALAVTAPVTMLVHLNLRAVIGTDVAQKHTFREYLSVRLWTTGAGLIAIAILAWSVAPSRSMVLVILSAGLAQSAENVSDAFYGALQRHERMRRIAISMMARAALSAVALGIALWLTHDIVIAVFALACARLTALLAWDARSPSEPVIGRSTPPSSLAILRTALPLGLVLMLVTLNTNLPRYAIERYRGSRELGAFAAVAGFLSGGNTIINALGQSATPRLARYFWERDTVRFRRLMLQLGGIAIALGAAGVSGAVLLGAPILRLLYRDEYAQYSGLLGALMFAAIPIYLASTLGYVITSVRAFDAQLPLFAAVAATCAIASWLLISRYGLAGAPIALAAAGCVQALGELAILRGAFRRVEHTR